MHWKMQGNEITTAIRSVTPKKPLTTEPAGWKTRSSGPIPRQTLLPGKVPDTIFTRKHTTARHPPPKPPGAPLLERDFDNNDREIWIEKLDPTGRRLVWYVAQTYLGKPNSKYTRHEYRGLAINIGHTVDHLPTRESGRAPP